MAYATVSIIHSLSAVCEEFELLSKVEIELSTKSLNMAFHSVRVFHV